VRLPSNIRAVLFDLDGTLRYNLPSSVVFFMDYAASLGVPDSVDDRRRLMRWTHQYFAQSPELMQDLQAFPDEKAFWTQYARRCLLVLGCPADEAGALAPVMHAYMEAEHHPVDHVPPEVFSTLPKLKAAGLSLGLLSNRDQPCNDLLAQLGLLPFFDLTLVAGEVNCWKPEPCVFEHALQMLDLRPEQVVYVGDNYYADIIGARQAGLHPVLIDPGQLFPEAGCPVIGRIDELLALL
jgi:putative hydrolase of the HAD superfamily